jgi:hypothetical protein
MKASAAAEAFSWWDSGRRLSFLSAGFSALSLAVFSGLCGQKLDCGSGTINPKPEITETPSQQQLAAYI